MKQVETATVLWTVRPQSDIRSEIKDIDEYTSQYSVESLLCSEIVSQFPDNCTNGNSELFLYRCYRLTLLAVNATLNESLISCGYETHVTFADSTTETLEIYYPHPFRLRVEKLDNPVEPTSIFPTTTTILTSTTSVTSTTKTVLTSTASTTTTLSPTPMLSVTQTQTTCFTVQRSCECTNNNTVIPTSAAPSSVSTTPISTSPTADTATTDGGRTCVTLNAEGIQQKTVAATTSVLGAIIIVLSLVVVIFVGIFCIQNIKKTTQASEGPRAETRQDREQGVLTVENLGT